MSYESEKLGNQKGARVRVREDKDVGNQLWGKTGRVTGEGQFDAVHVELDEPLGGEKHFKLAPKALERVY